MSGYEGEKYLPFLSGHSVWTWHIENKINNMKHIQKKIGVVIARLQTPTLHAGHCHVLDHAKNRNDILCVILGNHGGVPHDRYPLDIAARTKMVQAAYPQAIVLELTDRSLNDVWSKELDELLRKNFVDDLITLYGSRDSFIPYYTGTFKTESVEPIVCPSATEIRTEECTVVSDHIEFRRGMIYASLSRFPVVYSTVDTVPYTIKRDGTVEILVGQKLEDGDKYRTIGGFVAPKDISHAQAAKRELWEEVGMIEVGTPEYVGSFKIVNHRHHKFFKFSQPIFNCRFIVVLSPSQ